MQGAKRDAYGMGSGWVRLRLRCRMPEVERSTDLTGVTRHETPDGTSGSHATRIRIGSARIALPDALPFFSSQRYGLIAYNRCSAIFRTNSMLQKKLPMVLTFLLFAFLSILASCSNGSSSPVGPNGASSVGTEGPGPVGLTGPNPEGPSTGGLAPGGPTNRNGPIR
jgi:hypothetical protein